MKSNDYQTLAWQTARPFYKHNVGNDHTAKVLQLATLTLALNGSAGELSVILKRMIERQENIDVSVLTSSLGNVQWYVAALAELLHIKLEDLQGKNIQELNERYGECNSVKPINRF